MANLKEIAEKAFKANPKADHVYVTTDGIPFLNKNAADLHADTNPKGKKLDVKTFTQEVKANKDKAPKKENTGSKPSAEERIANISKLETIADVQKALKGETAKTVKAAGKKRIEALELKAKSGTNSPETRGNDITPEDKPKEGYKVPADDYVHESTLEELNDFTKDNEIDLADAKTQEEIKNKVIAYMENPDKVIVPFKTAK